MFYAYTLQSEKKKTFYYGHTYDLKIRLKRHNDGRVRSMKSKRPWKLCHFEAFETKPEAYRRELFFKSIDGYNYLRSEKIIIPENTEEW